MAAMELVELSFAELVSHPDFEPLVEEYRRASAHEEFGKPQLSVAAYDTLEESGSLHVVGVADDVGRLHGFLIGIVTPLQHFTHVRLFCVDAIFCDESARHSGMGLRLLRKARATASEQGLHGVLVGAKVGTRAHRLYERIGRAMNTLFLIEP